LFNDQQLSISMTQEKAKQYIRDIDQWLNEMGTLESTTSSFDLSNIFGPAIQHNQNESVTKSFSLLSLDEAYNAYANAAATCVDEDPVAEAANDNLFKFTAEGIMLNSNSLAEQDYNLNLKKESLINSIQYLNTQLISLREMFERRQEQLRNSRFFVSNNHFITVKRPEFQNGKQLMFSNLDDEKDSNKLEEKEEITSEQTLKLAYDDLLSKERLFSDLSLNIEEIQSNDINNQNNSNKTALIKRDSMNKVIS
jgi:hypothetical protein